MPLQSDRHEIYQQVPIRREAVKLPSGGGTVVMKIVCSQLLPLV